MNPLVGLFGGLALGGIKSILDAGQASREAKNQAAATRFSPWTGMQGQAPMRTNPMGNLLSGGLAGASFAQGLKSAVPVDPTQGASIGATQGASIGATAGANIGTMQPDATGGNVGGASPMVRSVAGASGPQTLPSMADLLKKKAFFTENVLGMGPSSYNAPMSAWSGMR